jgi:hypothetical protein
MFEPKRSSRDDLKNYIGARVTDKEEAWLRAEMKRRRLTMSDLIRLALGRLRPPTANAPVAVALTTSSKARTDDD